MKHDIVEKSPGLLIVLVLIVVAIGGLIEIVPLFFQKSTTEPVTGLFEPTEKSPSCNADFIRLLFNGTWSVGTLPIESLKTGRLSQRFFTDCFNPPLLNRLSFVS